MTTAIETEAVLDKLRAAYLVVKAGGPKELAGAEMGGCRGSTATRSTW